MTAKSSLGIAAGIAVLALAAGVALHLRGDGREARIGELLGASASAGLEALPDASTTPAADRAASERAAPLVAERVATGCSVAVIDPDGKGVEGAKLVLFRDDALLGDATTDAAGTARLPVVPAGEPPAELHVVPGCAPWRTLAVASGTTAIDVKIEEGARIAGRVFLDGQPAPSIALRLESFGRPPQQGRMPPPAVERALRPREMNVIPPLRVRSDAEGRFAFFGLPPREHATLRLPLPYEDAAGSGTSVRIDPPRTDLRLDLRWLPSIRGRVVDRAGAPVAGWNVEGYLDSEKGSWPLVATQTDGDGAYRLHIHTKPEQETTAIVVVRDPAGVAMASAEFAGEFQLGGEVGDVVVDRLRLLALDARDEQGAPIDPFVVFVARQPRLPETPARAQEHADRRVVVDAAHARAGFGLPSDVLRVSVLAAGYASAAVPLEPGSPAVTLTRCASLFLSLRDAEQRPIPQEMLSISASRWPIAWTRGELNEAHGNLRGTEVIAEKRPDETTARFRSLSGGSFRILALEPGLPLELVLRDRLGVELRRETVTLAAGEKRVLQWTLAEPAGTLSGIVRGEGAPLAAAQVSFFTDERARSLTATTDGQGRFQFDELRARRGTLVARSQWFIAQELADVDVRSAGEIAFDLVRGRKIVARFLDARGSVRPDDVWLERAGPNATFDAADVRPRAGNCFEGVLSASGAFESGVLPLETLVVRARFGRFVQAFQHPWPELFNTSGLSERSFQWIARGPVDVEWTLSEATRAGRTLSALRLVPPHGGASVTLALAEADAARGAGLATFEQVSAELYDVAFVYADASGAPIVEKSGVSVDVRSAASARVTLSR